MADISKRLFPLRLDHVLAWGILAGGLFTVVVGAGQILSARSTVPIMDEWSEIDAIATAHNHQPPLSWLWSQHNEHRVVFYRLLLLADIHIFHGHRSILFWSMLLVQCAFLACLVLLVRRGHLGPVLGPTVMGLGAFCLFCPTQWQNFAWAFQISFLLPGFLFAVSLLGLLEYADSSEIKRRGWRCLALSILAASAATYSNANGVILWPLLLLIAAALRLKFRIVAVYAILGCVLIGSYLYHYASPSYHSSPLDSIRHPGAVLRYIAGYLGVILPPWLRIRDTVAASTGALGLLLAMAAVVWIFIRPRWRTPFLLAMLGFSAFSFVTAFMTALGRLRFGLEQAFQSRYQTFNLLFWFGIVTFWLIVSDKALPALRKLLLPAIFVAMLLAITQFPLVLRAGRLLTLRSEAAAVSLLTGVPDKEALAAISFDPEVVWNDLAFLRQQKLFMFSDRWYGQIGSSLSEFYRVESAKRCNGQVQVLERVPLEDSLTGRDPLAVRISGWAVNLPEEDAVRRLVIVSDDRIVGFAVGGFQVDTVTSRTLWKKPKLVDWLGSARLGPATLFMDIYAVDNHQTDQLCPLARAPISSFQQFGQFQ